MDTNERGAVGVSVEEYIVIPPRYNIASGIRSSPKFQSIEWISPGMGENHCGIHEEMNRIGCVEPRHL